MPDAKNVLYLWKFTLSIKKYASHVDGHFWSPGTA